MVLADTAGEAWLCAMPIAIASIADMLHVQVRQDAQIEWWECSGVILGTWCHGVCYGTSPLLYPFGKASEDTLQDLHVDRTS